MNTPTEPKLEIEATEQRPLIPLAQMISVAPTDSFGGWGPCLVGTPSVRLTSN